MKPEDFIKQFIAEMHEWETWANHLMNEADSGNIDEDEAEMEIDARYTKLAQIHALKPEDHAVQFEDPPDYHPSETIIRVEDNEGDVLVLTRQVHKNSLFDGAKDPNCEVTYVLTMSNGQWKIKRRTKKDSDGDIFDTGI
jgi:hypothetical protein